jgi:hypothetical protein
LPDDTNQSPAQQNANILWTMGHPGSRLVPVFEAAREKSNNAMAWSPTIYCVTGAYCSRVFPHLVSPRSHYHSPEPETASNSAACDFFHVLPGPARLHIADITKNGGTVEYRDWDQAGFAFILGGETQPYAERDLKAVAELFGSLPRRLVKTETGGPDMYTNGEGNMIRIRSSLEYVLLC